MKKKEILLSVILLIVITAITFSPALKNGFTLWDDNIYITENPLIKNISFENIKNIFSDYTLGNYHPLTLLSFSIEYYFFGANPRAYHSTNIVLHIMNCILVFFLILIISRRISVSLLAALLFGLHPLRVESVAWISDRKDLLYAFFFLLSIICYLFYHRKNRLKYFIFSLIAFALSLLCKAMAVTLPILLVIFDYFLKRKFDRKLFFEKIPFFVMAIAAGIVNIIARHAYQLTLQEGVFSISDRVLVNIHRLVFYYLMRVFVPVKLSFLKPYVSGTLPLPFFVFVLAGLIIIGVLSYFVISSIRYTRYLFFGSAFFIITLSPVLFVTVLGYSADRFTYVASLGLIYIISQTFFRIYNKRLKENRIAKTISIITLCGIVGLLSFLSWKRCYIWKNSITLENYFVKNYPKDPRVYLNRAVAYEENGDIENAIADYSKALRTKPDYLEAYLRRGIVYYNQGFYDPAVKDFSRALQIDPYFAQAHFHRAIVYDFRKDYEHALLDFTKALQNDPEFEAAYYNRGVIYLKLGKYDNAISDFNEAIKIKPNYPEAYVNRGIVNGLNKRHEQAILDFTQAIKIKPGFVQAYNNRGFSYGQIGEYNQAIADFTKAIALDPDFAEAYRNRGSIFREIGEYEQAINDYSDALRINPNDQEIVKMRDQLLDIK